MLQDIGGGTQRHAAKQRKAILQAGSALACVLPLWSETERLTEISLMDTTHASSGIHRPVIALDQQECPIQHHARLDRRNIGTNRRREAHHECFVLARTGKALNRRFENVGRRLSGNGQRHRTVHQHHRELGLSAGERQSQTTVARQQGTRRQRIEHPYQTCLVQRSLRRASFARDRPLSRGQKLYRARDIAAKPIKKGEFVGLRDTRHPRHRVTLALLGQETTEERSTLATGIWLLALGQRDRQREGIRIAYPIGIVGEAERAVAVLRELGRRFGIPTRRRVPASFVRCARALRRRNDVERAAERVENLKRLADLRGGLAGLELNHEAQTDACRTRELILPQSRILAGGSDDTADVDWCQSSAKHEDDDVIASLKEQAKANHRSLEGEIRHLLAQQVSRHTRLGDFRERIARLGALTADRAQTDSVSLLREDRDR